MNYDLNRDLYLCLYESRGSALILEGKLSNSRNRSSRLRVLVCERTVKVSLVTVNTGSFPDVRAKEKGDTGKLSGSHNRDNHSM